VIAKLRANEPVRLFVYPAVLALAVYLVGRGAIDAEWPDIITGIAALVLGIPAAEAARRQVTAPAHLGDALAPVVDSVLSQVEDGIAKHFGDAGTAALQQIRDRVAEMRDSDGSGGQHRADR
jgi:hypothetical protein